MHHPRCQLLDLHDCIQPASPAADSAFPTITAKSICALRANETDRQASARMPARGFLIEDPAGSQGQTGNNGFFPPLLLFREEGQIGAERG